MDNKTIYDKTMLHHKQIVKKSLALAKPTKKKMTFSMICGGSILLTSVPAKLINDKLALGLFTAGVLQLTTASIIRAYIQKKK